MNIAANPSTIDLSVSEIATGIAAGSIDPVRVVDDALARIKAKDGAIHAFAYLDTDGARATAAQYAQEAKAGKLRGPLHGVPIGIKDVLHVTGMPTLANSKTMDPAARYPDSGVAAALRKAGAIIMGKCETVEFAGAGIPPQTRNPWNLGHTAGGSSSGSGAAVGARMIPAAIGTQTGGSNLRPAAYCGISGFKPSYGGLSRRGVLPLAWSLDHPGIIARTAADCSLIYRTIARRPPAREESRRAWRIGLLRPFFLERSEPETAALVEKAGQSLVGAGASLGEPPLPDIFKVHRAVQRLIMSTEMVTFHSPRRVNHADTISDKTRLSVEAFSLVPAVYYLQALRIRRLIKEQLAALFDTYDILIMPTAPGPAPEGIESTGDASFLSPWSLVGFPAATVPCGLSGGLPVGLQLVGPPGADGRVLAAAEFAQSILGPLTLPA